MNDKSDIALPDGMYKIITANQEISSVNNYECGDCDCACVSPLSSKPYPAVSSVHALPGNELHHLVLAPELYIQPVNSDFSLVFNLQNQEGRAVLNLRALQLLESFRRSQNLRSQSLSFAGNNRESLNKAIIHLANLSLLQSSNSGKSALNQQTGSLPPNRQIVAWLHITNQCNLRCSYCYLHKTPDAMSLKTGYQSIDAVLRSAQLHHFDKVKLKFSGGEPTLNFSLVRALQSYAEMKCDELSIQLESAILSNGTTVGPRIISFLKEHNMRLMISLDGLGNFHDRSRPFINGKGSFPQVSKSIDRLLEQDIRPDISITISNRNLDGLPDTVKYLLERDIPFSLNFYRENEYLSPVTDLRFANQKIIEAMRKAFDVIEKHLPPRNLLGAIMDRARLDKPHDFTCGMGQNYMVIDQNGNITKCQMEIEKPVTSIHAYDPLALIQADQFGLQNPPVEDKEGCRDCLWRYWCAGGCPLLTYRTTGRFDDRSPNCEVYKALLPQALRLEGLRILKYGKSLT